jgi:hypothetical protein
MLDPARTTPGTLIAVSPDGSEVGSQILAPGDVAVFDKPIPKFFAWNAAGNVAGVYPSILAVLPQFSLGWVGFVAADDPAKLPPRTIKGGRFPSGLILRGSFDPAAVGVPPTMNGAINNGAGSSRPFVVPYAQGLRVTAACLDGADHIIATPADFGLTLRPFYAIFGQRADLSWTYPYKTGLDDVIGPGDGTQAVWSPAADADLVFAVGRESVLAPISVPGGLCSYGLVAFAGTGVAKIAYLMEVY